MPKAQFFTAPDGSEFAILPRADYDVLVAAERDATERRRAEVRRADVPAEVAAAIAKGGHPVQVLRRWRGMSQQQLADKVNLSKSYLSRIENGRLAPGDKTRRRLAELFGVPEKLLMRR